MFIIYKRIKYPYWISHSISDNFLLIKFSTYHTRTVEIFSTNNQVFNTSALDIPYFHYEIISVPSHNRRLEAKHSTISYLLETAKPIEGRMFEKYWPTKGHRECRYSASKFDCASLLFTFLLNPFSYNPAGTLMKAI